jgi:hypothetical protein
MSRTLTWVDAAGVSTVLDGSTGFTALWAVGLDAPAVELNLAPYLSADGSVLVNRRHPHRRIALPMLINTGAAASTAVGQAAAFFQGPGTLRYTGENTRELIDVIYEVGMEGDWSEELAPLETWRKLVVGLVALDPWWRGAEATSSLTFGVTVIPFSDAGTAFSAAIGFDGSDANPVTVAGDGPAFPVTTITGPFTTLSVGVVSGQVFALAAPLASGSTITIDTNPGSRGPRLNTNAVDWSLLTPESRLWELPVGVSVLNAAATGSTGASLIEVSYRERWLTP